MYYQNTHHNLILSIELLLDSSYVWLCCFILNFLCYSKIALCDGLRAPILLVSFPPYLPPFSFPPRSCFTSETFSFFLFSMALHHIIYCSSWTFFLWADIISSSAYRCQPLCMSCILICKFDIPIYSYDVSNYLYLYLMLTNDPYEYYFWMSLFIYICLNTASSVGLNTYYNVFTHCLVLYL